MKKIYNAPEADLLCFRPMEDLAIDFGELIADAGKYGNSENAASVAPGDIKINAK